VNATKNERIKFFANFCNIIASAIFATGTFGPWVTYFYSKLFDGTPIQWIVTGSAVCFVMSLGIHSLGHLALGGLEKS
jgi:hypothetical protein